MNRKLFAILMAATNALVMGQDAWKNCRKKYCSIEINACENNQKCNQTTTCVTQNCLQDDQDNCLSSCGPFSGNVELMELIQCESNHGCDIPIKRDHGICYIKYNQSSVLSYDQWPKDTSGQFVTFWQVKGSDCNQNNPFDRIHCSHSKLYDNGYIEEIMCRGDNCTSNYFSQWKINWAMPDRKDLYHSYRWGKDVVYPDSEWRQIISFPKRDWLMLAICKSTPYGKFNTLEMHSTSRRYTEIPHDVKKMFEAAAAEYGFSLDDMCERDNTKCAD